MRRRVLVGLVLLATALWPSADPLNAAPPKRKLLGPSEREAVLALLKAVDLAQASDANSDSSLGWAHHVLK